MKFNQGDVVFRVRGLEVDIKNFPIVRVNSHKNETIEGWNFKSKMCCLVKADHYIKINSNITKLLI